MLRRLIVLPILVALATLIMFFNGCSSSNAKIRFVQAIPDVNSLQPVDIYIDGGKVESSVSFSTVAPATGYLTTHGGSRHVQVFIAGQTTLALFDGSVTLSSGSVYTLVLTGFSNFNQVST